MSSDTPRTDAVTWEPGATNRGNAYEKLCCELEREATDLRRQLAESAAKYQSDIDTMAAAMAKDDVEIELLHAELATAKEKYRLLSAQHARLCDQVYEEDGETLKMVALQADARELWEAAHSTYMNAYPPNEAITVIEKHRARYGRGT